MHRLTVQIIMITVKRVVKKMQEQINDWKDEINKIAEKSVRRSKEILKNLGDILS